MGKIGKRICSLLLAGLITLPCFANNTIHATENRYSRASEVLTGIGISSGIASKEDNDTVARKELAVMLSKIVGDVPVSGKHNIADIAESDCEPAIQSMLEARIMLAYEDGSFRPDETVTWDMALRSMLALTGYDRVVSKKGDTFYNNRAQAKTLGILKGLQPEKREIRWEELCELVYQTLDVPILYSYQSGNEHFAESSGNTVMSHYLNMERTKGIVQSVGKYSLSGVKQSGWGKAVVGGTVYQISSETELLPMLGYRAEVYYKRDSNDAEIVCAVKTNEKQLKIDVSIRDIAEFDETTRHITYQTEQDKRPREFSIPADADVLLNGSLIKQSLKNVLDNTYLGRVQGIDNNLDGKADVFLISRQDVYVVDSVNPSEEIIYIKVWKRNGQQTENGIEKISLKNMERVSITDMQGYARTLSEIKAWDVIAVETNAEAESVAIICPFESVMGVAQTVSGSGEEQKIVIDGKKYEMSKSYFSQYGQAEALDIGISYTLKLDTEGRIAAVVKSRIGKGQLGYLIDIAKSQSLFGGGDAQVKLLTEDGQIQLFSLGKVKVDGITCKNGDDAVTAIESGFDALDRESGSEIARLIIYEVNDKQQILSVNTPYRSAEEDAESFRAVPLFGTYGFVNKLRRSNTIEGNYRIDNDAKVFVVPGNQETVRTSKPYNFMVKNALAHLGDGKQSWVQAFKYTDGSYNLDALVARQGGDAAINADTPVQLVKSRFESLDDEGNQTAGLEVITIDVYGGRNENRYYAAEPSIFEQVQTGDVVQVVLNDKGIVTYLRPIVYLKDPVTGEALALKKPSEPDDGQWSNYAEPSKVMVAGAYCREEDSLVINRGPKVLSSGTTPAKEMSVLAAEEADPTRLSAFTSSTYIYPLDTMSNVFIFDTKREAFFEGDKNDIVDYKSDPENYSKMMLFTWWGGIRCVLIYR